MKIVDLLQQDPSKSLHELPSDLSIKLTEISKLIYKSKRSTVLTGAGISCNAGIPDFRSDDGLYNLVKSKYPKTVIKGQDLFDISLFRDEITLQLFCTFMESLYSSSLSASPTETHKFIKTLKDKNKLLRCYTQNIDGLESKINLKTGVKLSDFNIDSGNQKAINANFNKNWKNLDVVQLHGNLQELSCTQCFTNFNWNKSYRMMLSNGSNPECMNCQNNFYKRLYEGKRLTGHIGILRPGIVLYGEHHPQSEILAQGLNIDLKSKPDLLIIMGTSLKVDGVKKLVKNMSKIIHDNGGKVIFVNKTVVNNSWDKIIDYQVLSDCDNFIRFLKQEIPDLFLTQQELDVKKLEKQQQKEEKQQQRELIKQEKELIKQEKDMIKQEKELIKQEKQLIKQEKEEKKFKKEKVQVEDENIITKYVKLENPIELTPPNTPKKIKANRVALKRRSININHSKVEYNLPSPLSSFNEVTVEEYPSKRVKLEPI